jgi:hypothetical protein
MEALKTREMLNGPGDGGRQVRWIIYLDERNTLQRLLFAWLAS